MRLWLCRVCSRSLTADGSKPSTTGELGRVCLDDEDCAKYHAECPWEAWARSGVPSPRDRDEENSYEDGRLPGERLVDYFNRTRNDK